MLYKSKRTTDISWLLKEARRKNNETQKDMAKKLGISMTSLHKCENGEITNRMYSVIMTRLVERYVLKAN